MNVSKRNPLFMIPLCMLFGILDYYMCDLMVYVLKIPLFFDTIFCIAMSFYSNPLYGILVVIFDHVFDMAISHSFVIYQLYMVCAFFGCLTVWIFKRYLIRNDDSRIKKIGLLLLLSLIMCLVMSITGGIISRICAYLNGDGTEYTYQTQFLEIMFGGILKIPLLDAILFRVPVNFLDRIATVFSGWGVFLLLERIPISKEPQ